MLATNVRTRGVQGASAFTLIELLIVVIIVGILAAAAVPLYIAQADRARISEATAGLGAIRTMMTAYRTEHGAFPVPEGEESIVDILGLDFDDNAFFGNDSFSVEGDADDYVAIATGQGEGGDAHRAGEVDGFTVQMNRQGEVSYRTSDDDDFNNGDLTAD